MVRYTVGTPTTNNRKMVLWGMGDGEFMNLTRSTLPVLSYWLDDPTRLATLCGELGLSENPNARICFEYPVGSGASGKPSFTDAMVLGENWVIAVEGKWHEPGYETVAKWREKGKDPDHRQSVVDRWADHIKPFSSLSGTAWDPIWDECVYQMLHRTASACAVATETRAERVRVVYQTFKPSKESVDYAGELKKLWEVIQPDERLELWLQVVPLKDHPTAQYQRETSKLLALAKDKKPKFVRDVIEKGGLFSFDTPVHTQIVG